LFESFVVAILRSHFYVTDSEPYKLALLYYRKVAWARLASEGAAEVRSALGLEQMPISAAAAAVATAGGAGNAAGAGGSLGVANIRLLPKAHGMRPIADMARGQKVMRTSVGTSPHGHMADGSGAAAAGGGGGGAAAGGAAPVLAAAAASVATRVAAVPNVSINSMLAIVHEVRERARIAGTAGAWLARSQCVFFVCTGAKVRAHARPCNRWCGRV
jgi:hypothetical protein